MYSNDGVPLCVRHGRKSLVPQYTRICDEDVDAAKLLESNLDDRITIVN